LGYVNRSPSCGKGNGGINIVEVVIAGNPVSFTPYTFPTSSILELAWAILEWMVDCAVWVVKNPAPRTTYENVAATTTKAINTIAASRPV